MNTFAPSDVVVLNPLTSPRASASDNGISVIFNFDGCVTSPSKYIFCELNLAIEISN